MTRPSSPHNDWRYLLKESFLILLLSYALLVGGSYSGLVLTPFRLANTVVLAVLGGVWLAVRRFRGWTFPHTPLDLPIIAALVVSAVTAAFSIDPRRSAGVVWRLGLYALVFYAAIDLLRHGWPAELIVKALLIIGAIVLVFALWHLARWWLAWHAIWGWARPLPPGTVRVRSLIGNPNWVAAFVNLLWPLAALRAAKTRNRLSRVILSSWLVAAAVVLYFTSSRGAWLGAIGAGAIIVFYGIELDRLRRWLRAARWRPVLGILATTVVLAAVFLHQLNRLVVSTCLDIWRGLPPCLYA